MSPRAPQDQRGEPSPVHLNVRFYRTKTQDTVRDELKGLSVEGRAALTEVIHRRSKGDVRDGENEKIQGDIWAVRAFADDRTFRAYYAVLGKYIMLVLVATEKKSRKSPPQMVKKAENRLRLWQEEGERRQTEVPL